MAVLLCLSVVNVAEEKVQAIFVCRLNVRGK